MILPVSKPVQRRRRLPSRVRRQNRALGLVTLCAFWLCTILIAVRHQPDDSRRLSSAAAKGALGGCQGNAGGLITLYALGMIYLFMGLAVVCDEFFVAALEALSEYFKLSEDVAGATFMAAGSSAPELFTSLVDTFYFESNVGIGTIVGSAVFNILVIIALSAACAKEDLLIDWRPIVRDILFYLASIGLLLGTCWPKEVTVANKSNASQEPKTEKQGEITWWKALLLVLLYLLYLLFMKFNAKLLDMCSPQGDAAPSGEEASSEATGQENEGTVQDAAPVEMADLSETLSDQTKKAADDATGNAKAEGGGLLGTIEAACDLLCKPWMILFGISIPDCSTDKWKNWFAVTFINSCVWIAVISWLLVLCAQNFGCLVGLGPIIMGVVFLAAGTSVPDAVSSVVVAREGMGSMAVANAIGSNVFDICLGLGIPYLIATATMPRKFPYVKIETDGLLVNVFILVGTVLAVFGVLLISKWKLTSRVGWSLMVFYIAFVAYNITLESTAEP